MRKTIYRVKGILNEVTSSELLEWAESFLVDRQAQNMAAGTLDFYRKKLKVFLEYCQAQSISEISQIDPSTIRRFIFYLKERGHNPGGTHAFYRVLRTFLYWYEVENEPADWRNPIRKTKAPRLAIEPISPVEISDVFSMVEVCNRNSFHGTRDAAMLLGLLDTGARAAEFLQIRLEDLNQVRGSVLIRQGKGRKPRTVFLGSRSRKALRSYLNRRKDESAWLWVTDSGSRLSYDGLYTMIERRARDAGLQKAPSPHSFRRAFALAMLRAGVDTFSLSKLMGHADTTVLQRYLKQTVEDTEAAHHLGSPVDHAGG